MGTWAPRMATGQVSINTTSRQSLRRGQWSECQMAASLAQKCEAAWRNGLRLSQGLSCLPCYGISDPHRVLPLTFGTARGLSVAHSAECQKGCKAPSLCMQICGGKWRIFCRIMDLDSLS